MPIDFDKLDGANAEADPGELQQAIGWAEHLTEEEVKKIHSVFVSIAQAEDKKKAIIENAFFLLQLGKIILTRI